MEIERECKLKLFFENPIKGMRIKGKYKNLLEWTIKNKRSMVVESLEYLLENDKMRITFYGFPETILECSEYNISEQMIFLQTLWPGDKIKTTRGEIEILCPKDIDSGVYKTKINNHISNYWIGGDTTKLINNNLRYRRPQLIH